MPAGRLKMNVFTGGPSGHTDFKSSLTLAAEWKTAAPATIRWVLRITSVKRIVGIPGNSSWGTDEHWHWLDKSNCLLQPLLILWRKSWCALSKNTSWASSIICRSNDCFAGSLAGRQGIKSMDLSLIQHFIKHLYGGIMTRTLSSKPSKSNFSRAALRPSQRRKCKHNDADGATKSTCPDEFCFTASIMSSTARNVFPAPATDDKCTAVDNFPVSLISLYFSAWCRVSFDMLKSCCS